MLSDMHEKLSQAVKLYDQLLTEQVVHPHWRSQPMNAYHSPTPAMNGAEGLQSQWTGSTQGHISAEAAHATWHPAQQQAQYSPAMSFKSPQPVTSAPRQPYLEATPYQYAGPTPTPNQPIIIHRQVPMQHHSTSGPVVAAVKSPPPAVASYDLTATPGPHLSSSLTRSHTTSSTYSPASTSAHLRSNTISHTVGHAQVQQQQHFRNQSLPQHAHVPQHVHVASPPTPAAPVAPVLPHFPSAPTGLPQTMPTFSSSIPAGVPQREERKEALLIEL